MEYLKKRLKFLENMFNTRKIKQLNNRKFKKEKKLWKNKDGILELLKMILDFQIKS